MKMIPLTKGKVALVDDEDYAWLSQFKWFALVHRENFYAARSIGKSPNKTAIKMHRAIIQCPDDKQIDHIDGNGLNNQKSNLRIATQSQNIRNRGKQKNNTSGFKGVTFSKATGKWMVRIGYEGKRLYLGVFETKETAQKIYNDACKQYHGDFAKTT